MHCDRCKEFIHANSPGFSLAKEFIDSVDPDHEERVWQKFQRPEDILPDLQAWLGGGENPAAVGAPPPASPARTEVIPASHLARNTNLKADAALQKTRAWLASTAVQDELGNLSPTDAAEAALRKLYEEFTGAKPQG